MPGIDEMLKGARDKLEELQASEKIDPGEREELERITKAYFDKHGDTLAVASKDWLVGLVAVFRNDSFDPRSYMDQLGRMSNEELLAEIVGTSDEIAAVRKSVERKDAALKDLRDLGKTAARHAIVAGATVFLGPVGGAAAGAILRKSG